MEVLNCKGPPSLFRLLHHALIKIAPLTYYQIVIYSIIDQILTGYSPLHGQTVRSFTDARRVTVAVPLQFTNAGCCQMRRIGDQVLCPQKRTHARTNVWGTRAMEISIFCQTEIVKTFFCLAITRLLLFLLSRDLQVHGPLRVDSIVRYALWMRF